jgi:polysaccharide deacetylase family protein (PEP-CTERM system associated)
MSQPLHSMSFDVEEWFQVANHSHACPRERWDEFESRVEPAMGRILDLLERRDCRATMFFLGWIAERHPDLVRRCLDAGHEVASHGYDHRFLGELGPEGLHADLQRTEEALAAAGAPKPRGFRASTFTLNRETWWAFDVLLERGYTYDSSVHPIRHPTYGVPGFEPAISRVDLDGGSMVEFPVSTFPMLGRNWPVGGGGYFRLLPGPVQRSLIASLERRGRATATYLHPWEFDPEQPLVKASLSKRFRHRVGLGRTLDRLDAFLERFPCESMENVLGRSGFLEE